MIRGAVKVHRRGTYNSWGKIYADSGIYIEEERAGDITNSVEVNEKNTLYITYGSKMPY